MGADLILVRAAIGVNRSMWRGSTQGARLRGEGDDSSTEQDVQRERALSNEGEAGSIGRKISRYFSEIHKRAEDRFRQSWPTKKKLDIDNAIFALYAEAPA